MIHKSQKQNKKKYKTTTPSYLAVYRLKPCPLLWLCSRLHCEHARNWRRAIQPQRQQAEDDGEDLGDCHPNVSTGGHHVCVIQPAWQRSASAVLAPHLTCVVQETSCNDGANHCTWRTKQPQSQTFLQSSWSDLSDFISHQQSLIPCEKFRSPHLGKTMAAETAAIPVLVYVIF